MATLSPLAAQQGATREDLQQFHDNSKTETSLIYTKIDLLKWFRKLGEVMDIKKKSEEE